MLKPGPPPTPHGSESAPWMMQVNPLPPPPKPLIIPTIFSKKRKENTFWHPVDVNSSNVLGCLSMFTLFGS